MKCEKCGQEMRQEDKDTSSGRDMRTFRCDHCQQSHIVDYGIALWKVMSGDLES
jgi:NAD-dependent SIR2 family protein deacetylase